ncbi:MAG: serine/threonine-protein kinase [Kofleriaceae bacterium]
MKPAGVGDLAVALHAGHSLAGSTIDEPHRSAPRGTVRDASPAPPFSALARDPQRYVLLGEHGRGGLGRVLRAHDRELGRDVAVKELLARGDLDEVRFLREVLITARLEHPGIVPIHEAGRWPDGTPFYAMKLVSGRSLHDLIAERPTVEARIGLLHHVIAVTDAIAYAHGRGIIHRDLKPANVVVGDFGETIVIDWGLAKDLASSDDPVLAASPSRADQPAHLTSVGSVLGTPAYMSPEQKRGSSVDRRTDVYAIGTMLWELCAVEKTPPTEARARRRLLHRAGIDDDLATIIEKARDPDPDRRYSNAEELAADLKAFKSGVRISARSYSLLAMLAHWTRRHRTLAVSTCAALALVIIGSLLFVRNIAAERDRADASETVATRARASAESSLDQLTLNHAELLLTKDPSAAVDVLATYRGADRSRAAQIRAEAVGRGVALLRARPHSDGVFWTEAVADGSILSLSSDGTIARTGRDGSSRVVVRGVSKIAWPAYSPARHLLAYTCDPSDICWFDVVRSARLPVAAALRDMHVRGLAFSPSGARFAAMSQDGVLRVFEIADPAQPRLALSRAIAGGSAITFIDDEVVAVATATGVELVRMTGDAQRFPTAGFSYWATSAREHKLVFATAGGRALLFEGTPFRLAVQTELCRGEVNSVQFIPGGPGIAYACQSGIVGIWDPQRGVVTPRAQLEGHAGLVVTSPDGEYLVASGGNGIVTVIDLQTSLVASYKGHGFRLTSVSPPSHDHPFVISADIRGAVRAWPLPPRFARVTATSSSPFQSAIFDRQASAPSVTLTKWRPTLTIVAPSTGEREVGPHETFSIFLEQSRTGNVFATYGLTALVELWSAATMTRSRVIATGHGSVSQLAFVGDGDDFITSGHDGRVVRWAASGAQTVLAQADQPIDKLAWIAATGSVVFSTLDGALWRTQAEGPAVLLRPAGVRVTRLVAVPAHHAAYAGYANGEVVAIHTDSWRGDVVLRGDGAVQELVITDDAHALAVATNDGVIHVGAWREGVSDAATARWSTLAAPALHITVAPDGLLVAACTDGTIWLYSIPRQQWLCLPTGTADISRTAVTADGKAAVALDREGRLIWIDLDAARHFLDVSTPLALHQPGTVTP